MRYVYYCDRCGTMFEVEIEAEAPVLPEMMCPKCEYPHAIKAFAVAPTAGGCCGPLAAPRSSGGG